MMYYQLFTIPVISALIGYITNVVAIKMLFWPRKPINLLFFELQGLLPKRQADIAKSLGELVENQLLSVDDIFDRLNTPQVQDKLVNSVATLVRDKLDNMLPRIIPAKLLQLIGDSIEKVLRQEAASWIAQFMETERTYITREIEVKKIVEEKVNDFNLDEMEAMIKGVSSPELRFIEILGGILGFIIGLIQDVIIMLFPM
ncbi:MAG TPA: DUF445 domain-containing protein [Syntrophomonas sp.]|jgi:uncharacterized membrane protein YheB (UPF0754 family)|nr:DUF445 domain-containing protein [Syntrophomonas sp.]